MQTLDKPFKQLFKNFARNYLVDYYVYFITVPLVVTVILSWGFIRIKELTLLDARKLYTPENGRSWHEKAVINELWPLKTFEFLPEKTFEYTRFFYLLIYSKRLEQNGIQAMNLLDPVDLDEILSMESQVAGVNFSLSEDQKLHDQFSENGTTR